MAAGTSSPIRTPLPEMRRTSTADDHLRSSRRVTALWYLGGLGLALLLVAAFAVLGPTPAAIGWLCFLAMIAVSLVSPRHGLYLLVGLVVASDGLLAPWYPVVKNLSSVESLLYLHDAAIINPTELFLVLLIGSWLGRAVFTRKVEIVLGPLFWPLALFIAFIVFGFAYGLSRGGDLNIALWSGRAIFYLPLMVVLVSNLIQTREHVVALTWAVVIGLAVPSLLGFWYVISELEWELGKVLRIAEHPFSIRLNMAFLLLAMLVYFRGSRRLFWFLVLTAPLMLVAYIGNQRRAGYVALALALFIFGLLLAWQNRRLFWTIVPPLAIVFVIYLAIFWNNTGSAGVVARQVRGVIAPVQGTEEEASNLYRVLENTNILFTIRQAPLTGVGFGQKFAIIAPMADISFFVWWEYITHNSVVWIWMQAGIGGFLALLFLIGNSLALGIRRVFEAPPGDMRAIAFVLYSLPIMHFIFAYVDMSWDSVSMIVLGMAIGLINIFDRILARPVPLPVRRWPWQQEPKAPPGIQPL